MSPLEQRQGEDAEREAQRERQLKQVAAEMVLSHFGLTDWQRFRAKNPIEYLRAKIEVVSAPPHFAWYVERSAEGYDFAFTFMWGGSPAFRRPVRQIRPGFGPVEYFKTEDVPAVPRSHLVLLAPEREIERDPDEYLGMILREAERRISRENGIETRFSIRTDKTAWKHSQKETEG